VAAYVGALQGDDLANELIDAPLSSTREVIVEKVRRWTAPCATRRGASW
jgi:hypothetical protein